MIRAIVCPPDVPENYQEIILMFAEVESKRGKTGTMCVFGNGLLVNLRQLPLTERFRIIKKLCSSIEESLLQSSSNPGDVKVTEIAGKGPETC